MSKNILSYREISWKPSKIAKEGMFPILTDLSTFLFPKALYEVPYPRQGRTTKSD